MFSLRELYLINQLIQNETSSIREDLAEHEPAGKGKLHDAYAPYFTELEALHDKVVNMKGGEIDETLNQRGGEETPETV